MIPSSVFQEEYQGLRMLSYPSTNVFVVCFSIVNPESYQNVEQVWVPEIRHHMPHTPFVLCGTQMDLRTDEATLQKLQKKLHKPVSKEMGLKLAKRLGAVVYTECSSLTQEGLKDVFDEALLAVLEPKDNKPQKSKSCGKCLLL